MTAGHHGPKQADLFQGMRAWMPLMKLVTAPPVLVRQQKSRQTNMRLRDRSVVGAMARELDTMMQLVLRPAAAPYHG
jgi:hypothetical protein